MTRCTRAGPAMLALFLALAPPGRAQKARIAVLATGGTIAGAGDASDDGSGEINTPKSRVLLQLALMGHKDPGAVQRIFDEY